MFGLHHVVVSVRAFYLVLNCYVEELLVFLAHFNVRTNNLQFQFTQQMIMIHCVK